MMVLRMSQNKVRGVYATRLTHCLNQELVN